MNKHLLLHTLYLSVQSIVSWILLNAPLTRKKFLPQVANWKLCSKTIDFAFVRDLFRQIRKVKARVKKHVKFRENIGPFKEIEIESEAVKCSHIQTLFMRYEYLSLLLFSITQDHGSVYGVYSTKHYTNHQNLKQMAIKIYKNPNKGYIRDKKTGVFCLGQYYLQRFESFFDGRLRSTIKGRNRFSPRVGPYIEFIEYYDPFPRKLTEFCQVHRAFHIFMHGESANPELETLHRIWRFYTQPFIPQNQLFLIFKLYIYPINFSPFITSKLLKIKLTRDILKLQPDFFHSMLIYHLRNFCNHSSYTRLLESLNHSAQSKILSLLLERSQMVSGEGIHSVLPTCHPAPLTLADRVYHVCYSRASSAHDLIFGEVALSIQRIFLEFSQINDADHAVVRKTLRHLKGLFRRSRAFDRKFFPKLECLGRVIKFLFFEVSEMMLFAEVIFNRQYPAVAVIKLFFLAEVFLRLSVVFSSKLFSYHLKLMGWQITRRFKPVKCKVEYFKQYFQQLYKIYSYYHMILANVMARLDVCSSHSSDSLGRIRQREFESMAACFCEPGFIDFKRAVRLYATIRKRARDFTSNCSSDC